jgi:hypothetical protein
MNLRKKNYPGSGQEYIWSNSPEPKCPFIDCIPKFQAGNIIGDFSCRLFLKRYFEEK